MIGTGLHRLAQSGAYGNASAVHSSIDLLNTPLGTRLIFLEFPPGTKILKLRLVYSILGTGVTLQLGYALTDGGETDLEYFLPPELAGEDQIRISKSNPKIFDNSAYIVCVVDGADGADSNIGSICCVTEYEYVGVR